MRRYQSSNVNNICVLGIVKENVPALTLVLPDAPSFREVPSNIREPKAKRAVDMKAAGALLIALVGVSFLPVSIYLLKSENERFSFSSLFRAKVLFNAERTPLRLRVFSRLK